MALTVPCMKPVMTFQRQLQGFLWKSFFCISTVDIAKVKPPKKIRRKKQNMKAFDESMSWEDRLADAVTPLWRLSYDEQLHIKQQNQENILKQFSSQLSHLILAQQSPVVNDTSGFSVLPIMPSPVRDCYRNKSTFSVNKGVDGNPKTVGFYVGTGRDRNIICVNGDHLLNMPEKHKQVARCYQEFIRLSPLDSCLLFHKGGHWREVTVRTNAKGHTMVIVYFHPQTLVPEEIAIHKQALVDYFTKGPGAICELYSLFFQETSMTRCDHKESPYQLLYGQAHIHEELLSFKFRISPDAFFQINTAAAEVLFTVAREMCFPEGVADRVGGTLLDVCCGTGAIGITLSPAVEQVVGVELVPQAVEDARHNAALNGVLNCQFLAGKAEVILPRIVPQLSSSEEGSGGGGVAALVNPARAGLHYRVVRALRNQPDVRRLVYVSCKPDGEAMRNFIELCCPPDPQKKLTGEAFTPRVAVPIDMFPHTQHCELVLLFER
ncbi:tRNA (uracil-5-)-methyltransferase homolog B isoform X2 [Gadus chalcogrammus]|uniref:tRNA (uracil-5-)-methyltransferase homolog B isoform X2 n=1 Tax=Gadus chalcogrammus TaxID=1042646 RepID=UPI0024C49331|nr:tRNA (uracil-5-)-methyltransferase homolog B isoform X2 [Gadus chalcogrammus]